MNNKGQALVEFVLILPLFIFLLFAIIDFGKVINNKNVLENDSFDIINLFRNGTSLDNIKSMYSQYDIDTNVEENYIHFIIKDDVKMITPGTSRIFGNPYEIKVERYLPSD